MLDYGSGNLHSVSRALAHAGGEPVVTGDAARVAAAAALVIPGVGHFGHCVRAIREKGLDRAIADAVGTGKRVFGVCVGMQVLYERSDEDTERGLGRPPGWVPQASRRRQGPPHRVERGHLATSPPLRGRGSPTARGSTSSTPSRRTRTRTQSGVTEHGRPFAAAASRDNVFATQFHPEKSGDAGLAIYANFVKAVAG